jgi:nucleotide-binding universal stress UspA family protein
VVLLHVFDIYGDMLYGPASPTLAYATYEDVSRQHRVDELGTFGAQDFKEIVVMRSVEVGEPAETIVNYASVHQADLIAMPTHGRGRFRRLLLGSITAKVLHDTECPVLTTTHSEALVPSGFNDVRTVICAVDLSSDQLRIIRAASDLANHYGAVLRVVHAISSAGLESDGIRDDAPFQRFLFDMASERIASLQREAQTALETCIKHGTVPGVLREAALNFGAQLVVIGRGHATKFLGRFRPNVNAIIRESPCPVLSI